MLSMLSIFKHIKGQYTDVKKKWLSTKTVSIIFVTKLWDKTCFIFASRCGADPSLKNNDGRAPLLPSDCQSDEKHQALREHFEKLKFLEDYKNRKDGSLMGHKSTNSPYKKELEDLEDIVISWNPRTTLLDVLFMKRAKMLRYAKNETLGELYRENGRDFERTFLHYGWLLNLQYRRGHLRAELMDSAKKSLCYVLGTCIVDNCSEKVFKYFSNSKLRTLSLDNFSDNNNWCGPWLGRLINISITLKWIMFFCRWPTINRMFSLLFYTEEKLFCRSTRILAWKILWTFSWKGIELTFNLTIIKWV